MDGANANPGTEYGEELSAYLARVTFAVGQTTTGDEEAEAQDDAKASLFLDAEFGLTPALHEVFKTKSFRGLGLWLADQVKKDAADENGLIGSRLHAAAEWSSEEGMKILRRYGYDPNGESGPWMKLFKESGIIPADFTAEDLAKMRTARGREAVFSRLRDNAAEKAEERLRERIATDPDIKAFRAKVEAQKRQAEGLRDRGYRGMAEIESRRRQAEGRLRAVKDQGMAELDSRRQQAEGMRDRGMMHAQAELESRRAQVEGTYRDPESRRMQAQAEAWDGVSEHLNAQAQAQGWPGEAASRGRQYAAASAIEGMRAQSSAARDALAAAQTTPLEEEDEFAPLQQPRSISRTVEIPPSILEEEISMHRGMGGNFFSRAAARLKGLFHSMPGAGDVTTHPFARLAELSTTASPEKAGVAAAAAAEGARDTPWMGVAPGDAVRAGVDTVQGTGDEIAARAAALRMQGSDAITAARGAGDEIAARAAEGARELGGAASEATSAARGAASSAWSALKGLGRSVAAGGLFTGLSLAESQIKDEQTRKGLEDSTNTAMTLDQSLPARFGGGNADALTDAAVTTVSRLMPTALSLDETSHARAPVSLGEKTAEEGQPGLSDVALSSSGKDAALQMPAADTAAATTAEADIAAQGASLPSAAAAAAGEAAEGLEAVGEATAAADEIPVVGEVFGALFGIGMLIGSIVETDAPQYHAPNLSGISLPAFQAGV